MITPENVEVEAKRLEGIANARIAKLPYSHMVEAQAEAIIEEVFCEGWEVRLISRIGYSPVAVACTYTPPRFRQCNHDWLIDRCNKCGEERA